MLAHVSSALLIVNPFASEVSEERVRAVEEALRRAGPLETRFTERRGHATEIAAAAGRSPRAVYVFSGDGGFNEVLNGLDSSVPVGFVPGGGASVLPRALGLPRDPVAAAERLLRAAPRRISLGRANGRRFGFAAGLGFDAELVRQVDALGRSHEGRRAGNLVFAWTAIRLLAARRGRLDAALELVGLGRAAFALVANGDPYTYFGRLPLHVAPKARFEGGLDLVAPRAVRARAVPRLATAAFLGRHAGGVLYRHDLDRLEIRSRKPQPLQVDGEDLGDVEVAVFESERDAVSVLVPR
jgi:diacylglycerol kinase family enzyme